MAKLEFQFIYEQNNKIVKIALLYRSINFHNY